MITVKLLPRKDFKKKDGSSPICLVLTIDRKKRRFSLSHSVPLNDWDSKSSLLKPSHPDYEQLNLVLKSYKKRAGDIIYKYEIENKPLTFDYFESEFKRIFVYLCNRRQYNRLQNSCRPSRIEC